MRALLRFRSGYRRSTRFHPHRPETAHTRRGATGLAAAPDVRLFPIGLPCPPESRMGAGHCALGDDLFAIGTDDPVLRRPGLDCEHARIEPRKDYVIDVHPETVACRLVTGQLFRAPEQFRLSAPGARIALGRVDAVTVNRDPGITSQISGTSCRWHHPETKLTGVDLDFGSADPGRSVLAHRRHRVVLVRREECFYAPRKPGGRIDEFLPARHRT